MNPKKRIGKYILVLWGILTIFLPTEPKIDTLIRQLPNFPEAKAAIGARNLSGAPVFRGITKNGLARYVLPIVWNAARDYGLPVPLVAAIIKAESGFNPYAISPKGAVGLMQLMPETSQALGIKRPYDPIANVYGGVRYFRHLLDRFNGNVYLALAAYNAGPGAVEKHGLRIPPYRETIQYVPKVLNYYKQFTGNRAVD